MDEIQRAVTELNDRLKGLVPFYLQWVDPKSLELAPVNARFMPPPMLGRLVENIKRDGALSSVPLCIVREGKLRVISGNHRVKAAVEAEVPGILVMVLREEVSKDRELAIQLSHNAIAGEDNPQVLAELYRSILDVSELAYTGIPEAQIVEIEANLGMPSIENLDLKMATFLFAPSEIDRIKAIFDRLDDSGASKLTMIFPRPE